MSFDAPSIFASLLVGSIGFVLFAYGRKSGRPPHVATGIVMMIFPYFAPSATWVLVIGASILALLAVAVRLGM
jgi:hypothetical protein